ncbi:glycosyltransferase family 2 protein [Candidatus Woesearchaeota archaeon]|nr:glycosyltransferase family 2 protein [Candidatus Woesearchaeota archaeon]
MNSIPEISLVIPVYNEEQNIRYLYDKIVQALKYYSYELIFVDDGSNDYSADEIEYIRTHDFSVRLIQLLRNYGQTAAFDAGIRYSRGSIIVTLDADLQNDPADIPKLIEKLKKGYDVVSGWRCNRKDSLSKIMFSIIANFVRKRLTGEKIHDAGCSLKAYRRECFKDFQLYGEMHRYITSYLFLKGYKIGECKIKHHKRYKGKTKYNWKRVFKGFFDLLFIKFWADFSTRPIHFFGSLAVIQYVISGIIFIEQVLKAVVINKLDLGPLLIFSGILLITGSLTMMFGFLAEILIRMYYKDEPSYQVKRIT